MIKKWMGWAVGCALSLAATAALADAFAGANPITGQLVWSGFSNGGESATISGPISPVTAGQFYGTFDTDGGSAEADDFLRFLCIDISHYANGSSNPYTRDILGNTLPVSSTQLTQLTRLFDDFYPNKTTGTYYAGGAQTNFGSFATADDSAAFQLAVWEIWFGDGTDLTKAPFIASSAAQTKAQGWLDTINAQSGTPGGWTFYTFTSDTYQDYLSAEWSQPLKEAPEPNILLLLCSAVVVAGTVALRRRQTA